MYLFVTIASSHMFVLVAYMFTYFFSYDKVYAVGYGDYGTFHSFYGYNSTEFILSDVGCQGDETYLGMCQHNALLSVSEVCAIEQRVAGVQCALIQG